MGKLIYSMITSVDGYVSDADGRFGSDAPDEESHAFINELTRPVGTYLYGRRMYETMSFWETAHTLPDVPAHILEWTRIWQAADKVVYSTTLERVTTGRTRLERSFDPEAVRAMKAADDRDLTVNGPTLAAHAMEAGLVDEVGLIVRPVIFGGGRSFFPQGVRANLELLDQRRLGNEVAYLRYAVKQ